MKPGQKVPDLTLEMQLFIGECRLLELDLSDIIDLFNKKFPDFASDLNKTPTYDRILYNRIKSNSAHYRHLAEKKRLDEIPAEQIDVHLRRAEEMWLHINGDLILGRFEKSDRLKARNLQLSILKYISQYATKHGIGIPDPPDGEDDDLALDPEDEIGLEQPQMQSIGDAFGSLDESALADDSDIEKV